VLTASVYRVEVLVTSLNAESSIDFVIGSSTPQYTKTHTTDSLKRKSATKTHTTDANKKKSGVTKTHTTDSYKNTVGNFRYEDKVSVPTDDSLLANSYSSTDFSNVASDDSTYKDFAGTNYLVEKGWVYNTNNTDQITMTWNGKSTLAPSSRTVYLQIYNFTTPGWETIASNSSAAANTDFTLTGTQSTSLSNYYTTGNRVAVRVYQ
jgi:hypothetical protein